MVVTKDENMPISMVVGYMLKVIKSGKNITNYKSEFNAVKHGDYDRFFDLIKEPQNDFIAQWRDGIIKNDNFSQKGGDPDFAMLLK